MLTPAVKPRNCGIDLLEHLGRGTASPSREGRRPGEVNIKRELRLGKTSRLARASYPLPLVVGFLRGLTENVMTRALACSMLHRPFMAIGKYRILEMPNYSPIEAVRYFHIPVSTLAYWTEEPNQLVVLASQTPRLLSFKNLVELYVLEGLRKIHGVHTSKIRSAVDFLLETERSRHPLADYDLRTEGKSLMFYKQGKPLNASLWGQYEMEEIVGGYLHRVERDPHGVALRIFPYTKREQLANKEQPPRTVEINPAVCFGLPVLRDSRLTTGFLASRFRGGDSIPSIARSYGRPVAEITEAIEWELGRSVEQKAA